MRTKLLGLFLVVVVLLFAVAPSFASAQPAVDISVFNGACTFVGGVSMAPVTLALWANEAGAEVSVPEFGLVAHPAVGQLEFLVTPPVASGDSFVVYVNGQQAFDPIMQVVDCAPQATPPAPAPGPMTSSPGDEYVCSLQWVEGFVPTYAQLVVGDDLVVWDGYLGFADGQWQVFAHAGAPLSGTLRLTGASWLETVDIDLPVDGSKLCEVVQ
jgi:hypothetical protein